MQTDTPNRHAAPTAHHEIRAALRAIDARWLLRPGDLGPGPELDRLLAPLLSCAARVAEPGAASHMLRVGRIAEATARLRVGSRGEPPSFACTAGCTTWGRWG